MTRINSETFAAEIRAAGLAGVPYGYSQDEAGEATLTFGPEVTNEQRAALQVVWDAHDPDAVPPLPPRRCTKLGLYRAMTEAGSPFAGQWPAVQHLLDSNADTRMQWELAGELIETDPLVAEFIVQLGLSETETALLIAEAQARVVV